MQKILESLEKLKNSELKKRIDARVCEFRALGKKSNEELFKELCFCILTANFTAERGIKIQKEIGNGFLTLNEAELAKKLKELGHRFPNARAKYIAESRKYKDELKKVLASKSEHEAREWLVEHIKGLGYKEASHFLRNIGFCNCAIIDFHIIDALIESGMIEKPKSKSLSKKTYLEIENKLREIAKKTGLNMAELDLYLWCSETGKVLK